VQYGKPEIARSNRGNQLFFVNKRYVKDRILTNSAEKAYKGMIPIGKFGFLILNLEMSPSLVDVNVHPAKLEVRFQEEQKVFKALYYAIQDTLLKAELIANTEVQLTGKLEKNDLEGENMEEEQKSTISGLFRKIAKNSNEDYDGNLIESIYKSKNGDIDPEEELEKADELGKITNNEEKEKSNNTEWQSSTNKTDYSQWLPPKENSQNQNSNVPAPNDEAIKSTIDEFVKMGKNLTAEQIREKIAKIAEENAKKIENTQNQSNIGTNTNFENSYTRNTEVNFGENALTKAGISSLVTTDFSGNYTEKKAETNNNEEKEEKVQNDVAQDTTQFNTQNSWSSLYTLTSNNANKISESEEKYDTKVVNTDEIAKQTGNEEQKPGDILLSILRDREKPIPSVPAGEFDDMYAQIFGKEKEKTKEKEQDEEEKTNANDIVNSNMSIFEDSEEFKDEVIPHKLVGIAFNTYIILEIKDELYILDQHAAHERIMYEKVKANYYSEEDKDSQLMLLPDVITLTHKEMDIARENMDKFEKAGFVLEEFGENTIKLTGVPNICLDLDTKELFLETLDEINTVARTAKQEIEEKFIATIACKAAVKANMALTVEEVESLLENLLKLPNPFTCPHGRPTAIKLSKMDIERKFARRK
jgi:DNA mismatch repair protein MutL